MSNGARERLDGAALAKIAAEIDELVARWRRQGFSRADVGAVLFTHGLNEMNALPGGLEEGEWADAAGIAMQALQRVDRAGRDGSVVPPIAAPRSRRRPGRR